jgi:hypothetical protein
MKLEELQSSWPTFTVMPNQKGATRRAANWSRSKWTRFAILLSIVLYLVGVAFLATLKSMTLVQGLSTPEMFYGSAITIASSWVIFWIIFGMLGRKRGKRI